MSASDVGSAETQPDDTNIPQFSSGTNAILSALNPLSGIKSNAGNWAMVAVGVFLMLGALLISQKQTVVQVAAAAA